MEGCATCVKKYHAQGRPLGFVGVCDLCGEVEPLLDLGSSVLKKGIALHRRIVIGEKDIPVYTRDADISTPTESLDQPAPVLVDIAASRPTALEDDIKSRLEVKRMDSFNRDIK